MKKHPEFKTLKDIFDWMKTDEGRKEFEEDMKELAEAQERENRFYDRVCEKIHNLSFEDKKAILAKINAKYASDSYVSRYYNRKDPREPQEMLYWVAYEYAERYGKEYDDGYTAFVSSSKIVDDYFIVLRLDGQGSFVKVMPLEDGKKEIERCKKLDEKYEVHHE